MACCAFAVFLLAQLLAPFLWVRRKLVGDSQHNNAAVAWAPGASGVATRSPRSPLRTALIVAVGLELAVGAAAFAWVLPSAPPTMSAASIEAAALDGSWCRALDAMWEGG
jgi:hypothetical protein